MTGLYKSISLLNLYSFPFLGAYIKEMGQAGLRNPLPLNHGGPPKLSLSLSGYTFVCSHSSHRLLLQILF